MRTESALIAGLTLATLLATGCHVNTHKGAGGDNVDIGTPFGSMNVKTDKSVDTTGIGITPYPGATVLKDDDSDHGAADVHMDFGNFHLSVKAESLQTPDNKDKVLAFYRNDLKRYGVVILCEGDKPVGTPTSTATGLTCDENANHTYKVKNSIGDDLQLRTGTAKHQHIVSVSDHDGGTKIGIVALELPRDFSSGSGSSE